MTQDTGKLGELLAMDCLNRYIKGTPGKTESERGNEYAYDGGVDGEAKVGENGIDIFGITRSRGIDFFEVKASRERVSGFPLSPGNSKSAGQDRPVQFINTRLHFLHIKKDGFEIALTHLQDNKFRDYKTKKRAVAYFNAKHAWRKGKKLTLLPNGDIEIIETGDPDRNPFSRNVTRLLDTVYSTGGLREDISAGRCRKGRDYYRFFVILADFLHDESRELVFRFYLWRDDMRVDDNERPFLTVIGRKKNNWKAIREHYRLHSGSGIIDFSSVIDWVTVEV